MARRSVSVALCAVLLVPAVVIATAPPAAASFPPSEWVIGPNRKVVILTLEGQTKPKIFRKVLDALDEGNAKASFFMSGSWVAHHRDAAIRARQEGHAFGNRGWGKEEFTTLSDDALRASITQAHKVLNDLYLYPRPFLRAPKGRRDLRVMNIAGSLGYRSVRWTYRPGSGLPKKVRHRVVRNAQKGSIISLDIWRKSNREALPGIISGLRRRGFSFATLSVLNNVHPVRYDVTLRSGSSGSEVTFLQKTLRGIGYPAGHVDGNFGYSTLQATYAFEKANRLARDGVVPPEQMAAIAIAQRPWVKTKGRPADFVDVDISRQVLFEVRDRRTAHTLPISSGNEEQYVVDGQTRTAHTPRGNFSIYRKIPGKRVSHLGTLWWPNYFTGGYAIHGSDSVPTFPASHGCVRIPRYVEQKFYYRNPIGIPVYVHD